MAISLISFHTITPSHHPIELQNQKLNHNLSHQHYYYLSWASTYKLHTTTNLPNLSHPHEALPTHSIRALPHRPNINARNYFCAWKSTNHDFHWHWDLPREHRRDSYGFLQQNVRLTGLGCQAFKDTTDTILKAQLVFERQFPKVACKIQ